MIYGPALRHLAKNEMKKWLPVSLGLSRNTSATLILVYPLIKLGLIAMHKQIHPPFDRFLSLALYIAKQLAAYVFVFCGLLTAAYILNLLEGDAARLHNEIKDIVWVAGGLFAMGSFLLLQLYSELQTARKTVVLMQQNIDKLLGLNPEMRLGRVGSNGTRRDNQTQ